MPQSMHAAYKRCDLRHHDLGFTPVLTGDADCQANIYQQELLSAADAFLFVLGLWLHIFAPCLCNISGQPVLCL